LAGKADGRRPEAFRYLGEVLLRRGDATRADQVFERALRLDPDNAELKLWRERARMFVPVQKRVGMEAVAREVARTVPRTFTGPPPPPGPSAGAAPAADAEGFEEVEVPTIPRQLPPLSAQGIDLENVDSSAPTVPRPVPPPSPRSEV